MARSLIDFYKEIFESRKVWSDAHGCYVLRSEINFDPIPEYQVEPWNFAHVCAKNRYPRLKFEKINVVVMTKAQHTVFDDHRDVAKKDPMYSWVFHLMDVLKAKDESSLNNFKLGK